MVEVAIYASMRGSRTEARREMYRISVRRAGGRADMSVERCKEW